LNVVRLVPGATFTRLGAPHFPHFGSMRVSPFLTATVFFSIASRTRRSKLARSVSFDISLLLSVAATRQDQSRIDFAARDLLSE
jgi:hypothetical protein